MSIAAEHVIGGLLLDPSAFWRVADLLTPDDFPSHLRPLFERIAHEAREGRPFDFITAAEEGFEDAIAIANATAGTALLVDYAKRLKGATEVRRVQDAGRRIAVCESYDEAQRVLAEVRPQEVRRVKTVKDGLAEMLDTLQARASGVQGLSWGIPEVDAVLGRLVGARLYGIAARAKMGKTTFALQPQLATLMAGGRVLNFSLEMTAGELTQRALACAGHFSHETFERDDGVPDAMWPLINAAARKLHDRQWLIDDQPGLALDKIISRTRQHHMESPLALVVIDHMGLVALPKRGSRNDELGDVSYGLKNLAKDLNVPIISLLQLNRNLESRDDKRPKASDLRDSGNIEQDFDCIASVYRDEVYHPESPDAGHAEISTIANRHKRPGTAFVRADLEHMTYGPAQQPRRCFPGQRAGSTGGAGASGGVPSRRSSDRQPRTFSVVGGDR